ncbi:hypothetical protein CVT24_011624 [Panaeolus cyanescens]|uniref:HTH La-type RNA-binding domain-containing protein n=1 Tax=Panaeolus cyanescens TaxID=181874 RepID=A0A409YGZ5_9AGAR|nr:hypothetical protein CVT24_011624 [Panaeolus cyanescens]
MTETIVPKDGVVNNDDVTMESPVTATDAKSNPVADEEQMKKAMRQIEFYFADTNLPYDKFMWTLYTKDPEHWVPLSVVSSFKRMKDYAANGIEWVANAVRKSDFLEVSEDGTKVRRTTEPQEPKNQFERSIYAKGFGEEDATLQARLEDFFSQYGAIASVRMRRDDQKKFKGSVFVEFCDFDTVETFLKSEPKPSWNGEELVIMTKEDYCEMKIKEKGLTGKNANHRRELMTAKKFDAFREMAKAKSGGEKKEEVKKDVFLDFLGHKLLIKEDEDGNGTIDENDVPYVKGATLKFTGCAGDVTWSEIKDPIKAKFDGKAPYIKYARGENSGLVGFYKALSEEEIQYVKDTIKTINKNEVIWTLPSEEEEKQFEIERAQAAARTALQFGGKDSGRGRSGRGSARGRGGRGGRGGGRGGRGRGGRNGGGDRNREAKAKENDTNGDEATGEKRKRAVEPDGGPDVGIRGNAAPPTLQSIKRVKTNEGTSAPAS